MGGGRRGRKEAAVAAVVVVGGGGGDGEGVVRVGAATVAPRSRRDVVDGLGLVAARRGRAARVPHRARGEWVDSGGGRSLLFFLKPRRAGKDYQ